MKIHACGFGRIAVAFLFLLPGLVLASVSITSRGVWPTNWPSELNPFRNQSRTIHIGTGTQETVYEIPFTSRAGFERVWPTILKLKTVGAPLTLFATNDPPSNPWSQHYQWGRPLVRIRASSRGGTIYPFTNAPPEILNQLIKEDKVKVFRAGPPWPSSIVSPNGELPEYAVAEEENGELKWVAADPDKDRRENVMRASFYHRARVDIELVVDGHIIDWSVISPPADAPIRDRRLEK